MDCKELTNNIFEIQVKLRSLDDFIDGDLGTLLQKQQETDAFVESILEQLDTADQVRKRDRIAKELGLEYLGTISEDGLAWGKRKGDHGNAEFAIVDTNALEINAIFDDVEEVSPFRGGNAWINVHSDKDTFIGSARDWRLIDSSGKQLIDRSYWYMSGFDKPAGTPLCAIRHAVNDQSARAFLDWDGNEILTPEDGYLGASKFNNGYAWVKDINNGLVSLINTDGDELLRLGSEIEIIFDDDFDGMLARAWDQSKHKIYIYDLSGKKIKRTGVINDVTDIWARPFSSGLLAVTLGKMPNPRGLPNKYYLDKNGRKKLGPYYSAHPFSEDVAWVSTTKRTDGTNNNLYCINLQGRQVIGETFDSAFDFKDGIAWVEKSGQKYFIDKKGNLLFGRKFFDASQFEEGVAKVQDEVDSEPYYIDKKGRKVFD